MNSSIVAFLFAVMIVIVSVVPAWAHGVLSRQAGSDSVRFYYDDDSPMAFAYIAVFDTAGAEIGTGQSDEDGLFDYSGYENVGKITADDVHGHHGEHAISSSPQKQGTSSTGKTVLPIVVILLAVVAALFHWRGKKNVAADEPK